MAAVRHRGDIEPFAADLQRPAGINILLYGLIGFVRPDLFGRLTRFHCRLLVFGVAPPGSKLTNRIHESRSRIMNSIFASERLCRACRIGALNIDTGSKAGRLWSHRHSSDRPSAEILKIHASLENLKRIAILAQLLKMVGKTEKTVWVHDRTSMQPLNHNPAVRRTLCGCPACVRTRRLHILQP